MVYSEGLAGRVRTALGPRAAFDERRMFGGLAFLVDTHMAVAVAHDDLMVRVGKDGLAAALERGAATGLESARAQPPRSTGHATPARTRR